MSDDRTYIVYEHVFPNGKRYVGLTCNRPKKRWGKNGSYYRGQSLMMRAINKYGWDNIEHNIVAEGLTHDEACNLERRLISEHKTQDRRYGYNLANGGDSYGKFSVETRRKMSESGKRRFANQAERDAVSQKMKAMWQDQEYRAHMKEVHKGKFPHYVARQKCRENMLKLISEGKIRHSGENNPFYGKTHIAEVRMLLSEINKGNNHRGKPVVCIETGDVFKNIKSAQEWSGSTSVWACLKGKCNTAGGYHWRYADVS